MGVINVLVHKKANFGALIIQAGWNCNRFSLFSRKRLLCSYLHTCILHLYAFQVPVYPSLRAVHSSILILKNFNE